MNTLYATCNKQGVVKYPGMPGKCTKRLTMASEFFQPGG